MIGGEKNLLLAVTLICWVWWFRPILGARFSYQRLFLDLEGKKMQG